MEKSGKKLRVSIFGIGYVGAVTAACLAESGHHIIAVDIDASKVACLNEGRSPIVETGLADLLARNRISATTDAAYAIHNTDMSLICVGTPGHADGSLNLEYIKDVCTQIAAAMKSKDTFHIVVNRSTVVPGTLKNVIEPILATCGKEFGLANNPEFLREGTAIADYFEPTQIVVGSEDKKTADAVMSLYDGIEAPRVTCAPDIAESVKYVSNAWRASKVSFANEIGNILKTHGVDSHKVMDIFFQDTKINLGKSFLLPGFAFGGSCLPKDIRALRASANAQGLQTPLFDSLLKTNDAQIRRGFELIRQTGRKNVGLFGLSFKPGTDDIRESPLVALVHLLLNDNFSVRIYDPSIQSLADPRLDAWLMKTPGDVIDTSDVIVLGHSTKSIAALLKNIDATTPIIDLARNHTDLEDHPSYAGICW